MLDAVSKFLLSEVKPAVTDPALGFRVLVAANLASIAATEIRQEDAHDDAELGRLRALMPDVALPGEVEDEEGRLGRPDRHVAIRHLNSALAERIRERRFDEGQMTHVWTHVASTLRDKLSVTNPRFDTRRDVE